jgi:hypothetical protein
LNAVSGKDEDQPSRTPPRREHDANTRPVSDRMLAIFFIALAAALVLGYLLLSKLADMSQEEDCALAHRRNCEAGELPPTTRLASAGKMQLASR